MLHAADYSGTAQQSNLQGHLEGHPPYDRSEASVYHERQSS